MRWAATEAEKRMAVKEVGIIAGIGGRACTMMRKHE
jgi:hypothetical protein